MNPNLAVIFDEPQFPEAIHKKTHSGSRCANHLRQDFLTDLWNYLVGSRTGAVLRRFSLSVAPRFLWECLTSQTVNWFPAPAASNPSCRFPAMGLPACFASRVMRRFCLHLDI